MCFHCEWFGCVDSTSLEKTGRENSSGQANNLISDCENVGWQWDGHTARGSRHGTTAGSVRLQIQQLITRVWGESYCVRGHINHLSSTNKWQHAQRANPTVFYLINSVKGVRRARFSWEVVDVRTDLARQLHRSDCRAESCLSVQQKSDTERFQSV